MLRPEKGFLYTKFVAVIWLHISTVASTSRCPIGFGEAVDKISGDKMCYRLKGPEAFDDKFVDCAGNLFSAEYHLRYEFDKVNSTIWTEYKSAYPGGPFVDNSFSKSMGKLLETTYAVTYNRELGLEDELCVVIERSGEWKAVRCRGEHYSYCFVKPYPEREDLGGDGCEQLPGFTRFYSPRATCLKTVSGTRNAALRTTWQQAHDLCRFRNSSVLHRGWRYSNGVELHPDWMKPLGISMRPDESFRWYTIEDGNDTVPESEWYFNNDSFSPNKTLVALGAESWHFVNTSYIFFEVICERSIHLRDVSMNVTLDHEGKLVLSMNDTIDDKYISCFTDSVNFYPRSVKFTRIDDSNSFVIRPQSDGYYWCSHSDSKNFLVSQSNKVLFIRNKQSVQKVYAVKIRFRRPYTFDILDKFVKIWEKKLNENIFYRTKYVAVYGDANLNDLYGSQDVIKKFRDSMPQWKDEEEKVLESKGIRRLYLDGRTALMHVELKSEMDPLPPGHWEDLEVIYMKPAYYCMGFDTIPQLPLGESISNCRTHKCVGNFIEGVQWVTTAGTCPERQVETISEVVTVEKEAKQIEQEDSSDSSEEFPPSSTLATTTETCTETTETVVTKQEVTTTAPPIIITVPPPPVITSAPLIITKPPWPPRPPITVTTPLPLTTESVPIVTISPSPEPPEEQLQHVLESLEALLGSNEDFLPVENINEAFDQVDVLLDTEDELGLPGQLLHLLDAVGARANLNGSEFVATVRNNIALVMADSEPDSPVRGLRIAATEEDYFREGNFEIIKEDVNSTQLAANMSEAVVRLPESVSNSSRRISFVVFRTDRAFHSGPTDNYVVNSRVLSIKIDNLTHFENGEVIDIHLTPIVGDPNRTQARTCGYWQFLDNETGAWAHDGCTFIPAQVDGQLDTCRCDHLTHFAEILVPQTAFDQKQEDILEILSLIGCFFSLLGLALIGLTALLFRSWRRDFSNKIWLQLCVAIFGLVVCFIIIAFSKFNSYTISCMLTGIALHYSVLASFCWMLVAAVLSYRRLVLVFTRDASHKLLRAAAFAWGAPCAVIGVLLSIFPHAYEGNFVETAPANVFCYPSGLSLWLTVYAPVGIMLCANWVLFALIVRSVFASRRIQRHGDSNEVLRCASVSCLLVFLFGLPWIFGLFAFNLVAAYFFTLTSTFQGFVLFLFFIVGNKKTRDLWMNKLKIKQTRKVPVTSSTYTNKSSGTNWRGGAPGASTIEANSSKPRSLSSPDDRFS